MRLFYLKTLFWGVVCLITGSMIPEASGNVTLITLVTFEDDTNGGTPQGGLTLGKDGNFYGTTMYYGLYGLGTIFRISPNGIFTNLYSFENIDTNGEFPTGTMLQSKDGSFYGTTYQGGTNGDGNIFKLNPGGAFSSLAQMGKPNGLFPQGGLVQGTDGDIYGTTLLGSTGGGGTIFRITTNGVLATIGFLGNGANPAAGLVQGTDGNFYGTTENGGSYGSGSIFQVTTNGTITTVASFNNTNGAFPQARLIQASDGNFYGTAAYGGTNNNGTIFRMTLQGLTGTIIPLILFNGTNGSYPQAGLIQASDGNFYGTTGLGGASQFGNIFQLNTNGTLTTLYSFSGGSDGLWPWTELTQNTNGDFYGTTGGTGGSGTVFVFNPNWPVISSQPNSRTNLSGTTATFAISADGPGNLSYQWQFNGTNIVGGTNTSLIITNVPLTNAGVYQCVVSNSFGTCISSPATLTVNRTIPRFDSYGSGLSFTNGDLVLNLEALSGHGPVIIYDSTNLQQWVPIYTNPPVLGSLQILDSNATNLKFNFYRAVEQ
jgi:uncharacterized repeat protein (TIGR03803 family)